MKDEPYYACCEDGMLSQVPPTDQSGFCPACKSTAHPWDRCIRTRLIQLGWTPPDDSEKPVDSEAALASPVSPALAVPPGFALVPVEPTDEMLGAVLPAFNRINSLHDRMGYKREPLTDAQIYRAMVNAAPAPPASISPSPERQAAPGMTMLTADAIREIAAKHEVGSIGPTWGFAWMDYAADIQRAFAAKNGAQIKE